MNIINNLESILKLSPENFNSEYREKAFDLTRKLFGNRVFLTGILAVSNYCVNDCTYCGLRSENCIDRFRLDIQQLKKGIDYLSELGIKRLFLISGEDPVITPSLIRSIIEYAAESDFYITIGMGTFEKKDLKDFKSAGANEFCLKFETSNRDIFRRIKPSTDYFTRIKCIEDAAYSGFDIATGSITGLEGQTLEDVIEDIRYTVSFNPSWVPLVPYLPAPGTPMAENNPPGDIELTLRVISLLRLMLPESRLTAGQPAKGSKLGFADPAGNAAAVNAGANIFFIDATPAVVRKDFPIVGNRALAAYDNLLDIFRDNGIEPVS